MYLLPATVVVYLIPFVRVAERSSAILSPVEVLGRNSEEATDDLIVFFGTSLLAQCVPGGSHPAHTEE